jgi:hypothetical protein
MWLVSINIPRIKYARLSCKWHFSLKLRFMLTHFDLLKYPAKKLLFSTVLICTETLDHMITDNNLEQFSHVTLKGQSHEKVCEIMI